MLEEKVIPEIEGNENDILIWALRVNATLEKAQWLAKAY